MKGRDKCELLNEIRQKIADANDIGFTIYECTFEGDCTGTCPKCESEREYLEQELERKQNAGEKIYLKNIFKLDDEIPDVEIGDDCGSEMLGDIAPREIKFSRREMGDLMPEDFEGN